MMTTDLTGKRVLRLTLKKCWFDLMVTGRKLTEYRKPSRWILSRLEGKKYDLVLFTNGYGADKPWFLATYAGYRITPAPIQFTFGTPDVVKLEAGDVEINFCGPIETGNLQ